MLFVAAPSMGRAMSLEAVSLLLSGANLEAMDDFGYKPKGKVQKARRAEVAALFDVQHDELHSV